MTESSYFHALGEKKMYSEFGYEKYEVIASYSAVRKTCELCAEMDGKIFLTRDFEPGLNANPFHPNCHCTTVPYFDDFNEGEERFARGEDGKGYYVPSDMKYNEWKERFVEGVGENRMSSRTNDWTGAEPIKHTSTELEELNEYAINKGIKLYTRKPFDGDIGLFKAQIDMVANLRNEFKITEPIQVGWKRMSSQDFGETSSNHQEIWLNELALRNREVTEKNLRADNVLAPDIAEGIAAHEMGHIIASKIRNGKSGLDIYKETVYNVSGKVVSNDGALSMLAEFVSIYSTEVSYSKNDSVNHYMEIIPEMLSIEKTSPTKYSSEFARLLKEACGL